MRRLNRAAGSGVGALAALMAATLRAAAQEPPTAPAVPAGPGGASLMDRLAALETLFGQSLRQVLGDLLAAPQTLPAALAALAPDRGPGWVWPAFAVAALALAAAFGAEAFAAARVARARWLVAPEPGAARSRRIGYLLARLALDLLLLVVALVAAFLVAALFGGTAPPASGVVLSVLEAFALIRALQILFRAALAPEEAGARLLPLATRDAAAAYRTLRVGLVVTGAFAALYYGLMRIGAAPGLVTAGAIAVPLTGAAALALATLGARRALAEGLAARAGRHSWFARRWHVLVLAYLGAAVLATFLARMTGLDIGGLVAAPLYAATVALVIYGLGLIAVDATFRAEPPLADGTRLPSFHHWAERVALVVAAAAAIVVVLAPWGVRLFREDGTVRPLWTILLILLVAQIGWSAVRTAFDRKIAEELGTGAAAADDEAEGGAGRSRLATLLPLFRNAVLIAILVLAAMVVLSAIGVDVAPLFAGAGLIGFAVGFGAQTLVRDVFSGVFFLVDDAFRVGEYIETGSAKGTVEKISIRSMQLRHQNGPLHTIPFGEITQLTNYSRDWVIMKLPIKLWFGSDSEKVRKLVKKLGIELLSHPEIGHKFVEPLKSQGVYSMEDTGIVIRVKFKCRPGDQFGIRKVVYQRLNEIFEREGIELAGREVVVRVADAGGQPAEALKGPAVAAAAAKAAAGAEPPRQG